MIYLKAKEIEQELIKFRRELHMIPELGDKEYKTSQYIKDVLNKYDINYNSMIGTGIVVCLYGSENNGKTVLIRADIDALPITEINDISYKSTHNGIMHACGHDAHISCALGVCILLKENPNYFSGCVKIVFQPAEECDGGAERMIGQEVMHNPNVDFALALHVDAMNDVGTVSVRDGAIAASPDEFEITIRGVGGHGACPEECNNPIYVAAKLIQKLENIVENNFKDKSKCVLSVCMVNAGTFYNIIPDIVKLSGTVRSVDHITRAEIEKIIEKCTYETANMYNCTYEYRFIKYFPPVINNSKVNNELRKSCNKLGLTVNELKNASMTGDDFSYFSDLVPAAYFKLGAGIKNNHKPLHSNDFMIDESCLPIGSALLTETAIRLLKND